MPRSTLQRVAYRLENNKLQRDYWVVLDRTLTAEPTSAVLLDKVRSVSLALHGRQPAAGTSSGRRSATPAPDASRLRPIAVEITLELEDWGKIMRLVEVAG